MTAIELLDALAEFITEKVKDYRYIMSDGSAKTPKVYAGCLPARLDNHTEFSPFIVVKLVMVNDESTEATADVKIVFTVHDEDAIDNWRSELSIVEHVRQSLLKTRTIGNKFRKQDEQSYTVADYAPIPEGYGHISVSYSIGQPIEEDLVNYDYTTDEANICRAKH